MRHTFVTMGTVASLEIDERHAGVLPAIERMFCAREALFSLYRPSSELSRMASGELTLARASSAVRDAYARALSWRQLTDGAFTPHRPDGAIDLNGTVKAEAIESAGRLLDAAGESTWTINVGGDLLTTDGTQIVGIADPDEPGALLCSITIPREHRAVATSGSAQRGDHIWLGGSMTPASFVQVTVVADDIVTADVLATAIVAGGPLSLDDITSRWNVDVLSVDRAGELRATPGFRLALVA